VDDVVAAATQTDAEFAARFPSCFLLLQDAVAHWPTMASSKDARATTIRLSMAKPGSVSTVAQIVPVVLSGRQPYPMITVGRALTNDIILMSPSISKVHASFSQDTRGNWCLTDCGSSNGTTVAGQRLAPASLTRVAPGDSLVFGASVSAQFVDSVGLLAWARVEHARRAGGTR